MTQPRRSPPPSFATVPFPLLAADTGRQVPVVMTDFQERYPERILMTWNDIYGTNDLWAWEYREQARRDDLDYEQKLASYAAYCGEIKGREDAAASEAYRKEHARQERANPVPRSGTGPDGSHGAQMTRSPEAQWRIREAATAAADEAREQFRTKNREMSRSEWEAKVWDKQVKK